MSKLYPVFAVIAALLLAGPAAAAELKVGVINSQRLVAESPQADALRQRLEEEFAPQRREMLAQQNELKGLQEKFQRDAQVMSESERSSMERRIRDLGRDLQFRQQTVSEDLRRRQNEELGKLQQELQQAINAFAKAEGYDLILAEGVAFHVEALDVTTQILARIKK